MAIDKNTATHCCDKFPKELSIFCKHVQTYSNMYKLLIKKT